jgi:hypothetical protein
MSTSLIDEIKTTLISGGWVHPQGFVGCTPDEIEEIKQGQQVTALPPLYE